MRGMLVSTIVLGLCGVPAAEAQDIDFGDDTSPYARDGECDDPRFEGPGTAAPPLSDTHLRRDATDCSEAFQAGSVSLRTDWEEPQPIVIEGIDFGDDTSPYARDGECDDPRFEGPGTAALPLSDAHLRRDATDCSEAFLAGSVSLRTDWEEPQPIVIEGIDFGDDTSPFARDGECDDPRFEGPGTAAPPLSDTHLRRDATDCSEAFLAGSVSLRGEEPAPDPIVFDNIDFGDDASPFAQDGECDDPRFIGPGMASAPLLERDRGHDATDCLEAYRQGRAMLLSESRPEPGVDRPNPRAGASRLR